MSLLSATVLIFLVLDPFGNIPFFLCILKGVTEERRLYIMVREMLIALITLVLFLMGGRHLMTIMQISEPSLSISGGIVLFLISINMIFGGYEQAFAGDRVGEPFIVPLAIPAVAGPSAMATILLLMAREPARWIEWLFALLMAWFFTSIIVLLSAKLHRILGERVLTALERLMGMLLTTVAVEMFLSGIKRLFLPLAI